VSRVNGVDLFLLGRTLMKIGEGALPVEGIGEHSTSVRTVLVVLSDVHENPESAVGEVAVRTGLPQSAVSGAIVRLRDAGAVIADRDPADRRRTIVRLAPDASDRVQEVRASPIDGALASAIGTDEPRRVAEVIDLLEKLELVLTPQAIARIRR
jgi:DNA-binding MarR family transcriptional regulator